MLRAPGLAATVVLVSSLAAARTQRAPSPGVSPSPTPSPSPSPSPSVGPIRPSIDRVVNRMEDAREDPCKAAAAEGRPCFPVETTIKGEEYSVRKSLGLPDAQPQKPAAGGAPTVAEMGPYRPGSHTPIAGIGFDPGCVGKAIIKSLKAKNDTYYLYRVRDVHGDRPVLYDHKVEPEAVQGDIAFLGKYDGECHAVTAFRHEELVHPPTGPAGAPLPSASPSPSPAASPR